MDVKHEVVEQNVGFDGTGGFVVVHHTWPHE